MTRIATNIFTLVEFIVVLHVLLHWFPYWMILVVVHDVGVCNVLGVDAPASFNQWKLLGVEIFIRVGGKTTTHWLLLICLVIATGG